MMASAVPSALGAAASWHGKLPDCFPWQNAPSSAKVAIETAK